MSEPQKEYIITEELAHDIYIALTMGCDGTLPNMSELMNALRSRPYTSAENVLEKVIEWCEDGIDALQERQVDGYTFHGDSEKIDLLRYEIIWITEFQEAQRCG